MGIDDYDRIQFISGWQKILKPLKAVLPKAKPPEQSLLRRSDFFCSCSSCFLINPSLKVIFPSHSSPTKKSIAHRSSSNYWTEQRLQKGKYSSSFLFLSTLDKNIGWFEAATTQQNKGYKRKNSSPFLFEPISSDEDDMRSIIASCLSHFYHDEPSLCYPKNNDEDEDDQNNVKPPAGVCCPLRLCRR